MTYVLHFREVVGSEVKGCLIVKYFVVTRLIRSSSRCLVLLGR